MFDEVALFFFDRSDPRVVGVVWRPLKRDAEANPPFEVLNTSFRTSSAVDADECAESFCEQMMNLSSSRVPRVSTSVGGSLSLQLELSRKAALESMRLLGGSLVDHVDIPHLPASNI